MSNETEYQNRFLSVSLFNDSYERTRTIGITKSELCLDCSIQAEIELRDFFKQSQYFKELKPF